MSLRNIGHIHSSHLLLGGLGFLVLGALLIPQGRAMSGPSVAAMIDADATVSLEYYYQPGRSLCEEKDPLIDALAATHPDLNLTRIAVISVRIIRPFSNAWRLTASTIPRCRWQSF